MINIIKLKEINYVCMINHTASSGESTRSFAPLLFSMGTIDPPLGSGVSSLLTA
jgi:hypothetical protein